jgi:hypothetical protein
MNANAKKYLDSPVLGAPTSVYFHLVRHYRISNNPSSGSSPSQFCKWGVNNSKIRIGRIDLNLGNVEKISSYFISNWHWMHLFNVKTSYVVIKTYMRITNYRLTGSFI